ncbi:MAG: metallopeptidase family protein [Patescibacteria group bacterium]
MHNCTQKLDIDLSHFDDVFEQYITESMDELPDQYIDHLENVAIVIEDRPSPEQRKRLSLSCNSLLFGLYEGIPLTVKGTGNNMMLPPDKITLFKEAILAVSRDKKELKAKIKRTLWHEIAHYYGLDHDRMHKLEAGL